MTLIKKINDAKFYDLSNESSSEELNYEDNEASVEDSVDFHECESGPDPELEAAPGSSLSSQEVKIGL